MFHKRITKLVKDDAVTARPGMSYGGWRYVSIKHLLLICRITGDSLGLRRLLIGKILSPHGCPCCQDHNYEYKYGTFHYHTSWTVFYLWNEEKSSQN
jgi:hypothetical protein